MVVVALCATAPANAGRAITPSAGPITNGWIGPALGVIARPAFAGAVAQRATTTISTVTSL